MLNDELVRKNMAWLNREPWQEKKRVYHLWIKGQTTHENYTDVVKLCREKIRRAKAQLHFIWPLL